MDITLRRGAGQDGGVKIAFVQLVDGADASRTDGFSERYRSVRTALETLGSVTVISMAAAKVAATLADSLSIPEESFATTGRARLDRMATATFRRHLEPFERQLVEKVGACEPDVVFVASYRHPEFAHSLCERFTTVVFVEERPPAYGWGPVFVPNLLQRQIPRFDRFARRRLLSRARELVAITPLEVEALGSYWQRPVSVVPHAVDPERWPTREVDPGGRTILAVANFSERRNAEGLLRVIEQLEQRHDEVPWQLRIISGNPVAEVIAAKGSERFEIITAAADLVQHYRESAVALVPSFVVSGTKTTILQAWSTGVAVAAAGPSARSVDGTNGVDLSIANDPAALADAAIALLDDYEARRTLIEGGAAHLEQAFSISAVTTALSLIIDRVASNGALNIAAGRAS